MPFRPLHQKRLSLNFFYLFSHEIQMSFLCGRYRNPPTGNKACFQNYHQRRPAERYVTVPDGFGPSGPQFIHQPFPHVSKRLFSLVSQHTAGTFQRCSVPCSRDRPRSFLKPCVIVAMVETSKLCLRSFVSISRNRAFQAQVGGCGWSSKRPG